MTARSHAPTADRAQPRHVCFVAPFGLGQKTTVWARTLPLARELVQAGWEATILIPPWDTPADTGRCWSQDGVQIVNVQLRGGLPSITYRLLREISRREPDLVHIIKPRAHAGLVQWLLRQRRRSAPPLILDIDDWEQAWAGINRYPWPVARFLAWQEEWGIRHADGITAASAWLVERAASYAPRTPVLYLPNGIDAASITPPAEQAAPALDTAPSAAPSAAADNVLLFTRFVEVSPAWLAEFAASLYAIHPSMRLIVAGTPVQPGLEQPFQRALAATPAAERVEWLGFVPPAQLPALYARSRCAVFPAAPVPLQQAKCSVRLATTLLQGVPVVASAVGEQAAYGAQGAARLVPAAASPAEFAAAVADVLRHPQQQAALAAAAQARLLHRYAWRNLAAELMEFYTQHLNRDSHA